MRESWILRLAESRLNFFMGILDVELQDVDPHFFFSAVL